MLSLPMGSTQPCSFLWIKKETQNKSEIRVLGQGELNEYGAYVGWETMYEKARIKVSNLYCTVGGNVTSEQL